MINSLGTTTLPYHHFISLNFILEHFNKLSLQNLSKLILLTVICIAVCTMSLRNLICICYTVTSINRDHSICAICPDTRSAISCGERRCSWCQTIDPGTHFVRYLRRHDGRIMIVLPT